MDIGGFTTLPIVAAFGTSGIVVDTFEEVNVLVTEGILILIEVDDHVTDLRTLVSHGIIGGALQITDFRVTLEQTDDADGKLGLSRAFLAIDVQQGEGTGAGNDDVSEECCHVEAECHHAVIAIETDNE